MPALDINMIESLSRELHPPHTNLMAETEVNMNTLNTRTFLSSLTVRAQICSIVKPNRPTMTQIA